jgi:2-keto-4-pentenoate hydratase/2-oxohepta-3-ene-1,7-dioic acid hydratase in catechol pathway
VKIARYRANGSLRWGLVEGEELHALRDSPFAGPVETSGEVTPLAEAELRAPCEPSKVVLASGNYREVIRAMNKPFPTEPVIFLKPSTAVIGPGEAIEWPAGVDELTHEPELAVVIGALCRNVPQDAVQDYVLGYTCLNDVSAWDVLTREVQFTRAKGYDTFAPIGPYIVRGDFDPNDLGIRSYVNGEVALQTRTDDMVFSVDELVSFASTCMTLLPGDVVSTGASGVGNVTRGDTVEVEIDHVGRLTSRVAG